jgi:hypothetical protein
MQIREREGGAWAKRRLCAYLYVLARIKGSKTFEGNYIVI